MATVETAVAGSRWEKSADGSWSGKVPVAKTTSHHGATTTTTTTRSPTTNWAHRTNNRPHTTTSTTTTTTSTDDECGPLKHEGPAELDHKVANARWKRTEYGWTQLDEAGTVADFLGHKPVTSEGPSPSKEVSSYVSSITPTHLPRKVYEAFQISDALGRPRDWRVACGLLDYIINQWYSHVQTSTHNLMFKDLERVHTLIGSAAAYDTKEFYTSAMGVFRSAKRILKAAYIAQYGPLPKEEVEPAEEPQPSPEEPQPSPESATAECTELPQADDNDCDKQHPELQQEEADTPKDKWACEVCTFFNEEIEGVDVCAMCSRNRTEVRLERERKELYNRALFKQKESGGDDILKDKALHKYKTVKRWFQECKEAMQTKFAHAVNTTGECYMDQLPDEVLYHILQFLEHDTDLGNAELVCTSLRRVAQDEGMYKERLIRRHPDNYQQLVAEVGKQQSYSVWKTAYIQYACKSAAWSGLLRCKDCGCVYWRHSGACFHCGSFDPLPLPLSTILSVLLPGHTPFTTA
eukprot:TRINITY_DN2703_c0_g2_i2.p1 TRINITY_DN2703_c0_g2~~TRINITY_DN2703_c0_g2_i2.p1  ORF type:complete len:582 (-),score=124.80 TRINITY_DN2703_c0_g2_i2:93-1658(-)